MNVVVTGSGGYLGSLVAAHLRDAGHDVTGVDKGGINVDGISNRLGDAGNLSTDDEFIASADVVVHLAAIPGIRKCAENPVQATWGNIETTAAVARVCRHLGTPLVFASSVGVYGEAEAPIRGGETDTDPRRAPNFYMQTKRAGEDIIAAHAAGRFPAISLQMGNLYGEHSLGIGKSTVVNHFIKQANAGGPITVHRPGTQTRDFVHVNDAARAYWRAVERIDDFPERLSMLPVGSGQLRTVREVAEWAGDESGTNVQLVEHPDEARWVSAVDPSYTQDALEWAPSTNVEEHVREAIHD